MTLWDRLTIASMAIAVAAGTMVDRPATTMPLTVGGYTVIAADFHLHSSMWSDGSLTPWGLVLEAQRQGLDAIAVTGHNQINDSKRARRFAQLIGGPTVLTGQEILTPDHHIIAVGIEEVVNWRQSAASQIDDIHRQGGVAIAAHPVDDYWPGFDAAAMQRLDGAEICHPLVSVFEGAQEALEQFAARAPLAAIGSSDYHGLGPMGACRTYVFAQANTPESILEAVRQHRTVVFGLNGKVYGDPALIDLAGAPLADRWRPRDGTWLEWISRIAGVLGLLGLAVTLARAPTLGVPRGSSRLP